MGLPIAARLEKKRTLLEWLRYQAVTTEREIRDLEREVAEEKRRREVARREQAWVISAPRAAEGHPVLHRGNCGLRAKYGAGELLDRDGVLAAAEEYPDLQMCDICSPWGSLGVTRPDGGRAPAPEVEFP